MNLKQLIDEAPREDRQDLIESLAKAHSRPIGTVRKWITYGRHPVDDSSMAITEQWSAFRVTRFDERPDVFPVGSIRTLLENVVGARND